MRTQLFVVSDLHLGGEPGREGEPGFQMCPARNQTRLAQFVAQLPEAGAGGRTRLVLAGDVVDFLAEPQSRAFTGDQAAARAKLQAIVERTRPFWDALARFVKQGGYLTLMLGNHDIELCLPAVRRLLLDTLGDGRVEFIQDNEAFTCGPVLVEHGNRYDAWNAVPHGALRRLRSRLSRGFEGEAFPAMPGSQMVVEVMNQLKAEYSWVDLLKPETSAALPILAALGASNLPRVWKAFDKFAQSRSVEYDDGAEPVDDEYIAAGGGRGGVEPRDRELWKIAEDIASGGSAEEIGAVGDFLAGARDKVGDAVRAARRAALRKALRASASAHRITFDTTREGDTYLQPARAAVERGFEIVIYGHTHLAKNVELGSTRDGRTARYLNTGTWADLMRLPDGVFSKDEGAAGVVLDEFVADLEKDEVQRWRRMAPTYAHVVVEDDAVISSDLRFADEGGSESVTTGGLIARLSGAEPGA